MQFKHYLGLIENIQIKKKTFVLDFKNKHKDMVKAFEPYFKDETFFNSFTQEEIDSYIFYIDSIDWITPELIFEYCFAKTNKQKEKILKETHEKLLMLESQNLIMQQKLNIRYFVASYLWFCKNASSKNPANWKNNFKVLFFMDLLIKIEKQNLTLFKSKELIEKDSPEYKVIEEIVDFNYCQKSKEKNTTSTEKLAENQKIIKEKVYEKVSSLVEKKMFFEIYDEMKFISYSENILIDSAISNKLEIYQDHLFEFLYKNELIKSFVENEKYRTIIQYFWKHENYLKEIIGVFAKESYDKILENKEKNNKIIDSE